MNPEIEALIAAFYAAFDNRDARAPAGEALRAMFGTTATITRVAKDQADSWSPDAFIAPRVAMLTDGRLTEFHEWEVEARTIVLANIASRWSTYEKQGTLEGADYRGGGHKFIQMHRDGGRWLISSILWEDT
ncbi:MAG TPA: hypothetical protein VIE16_08785 [Phenylobacterium sp.]